MRAPSDRGMDGAGRVGPCRARTAKSRLVGTTRLLALLSDSGQCRTDGLVLLGQGAEAVALGVQLLLDEAQHLARDASPEQVGPDVRGAEIEASLPLCARRVGEPGRNVVAVAADLEREIALLVVVRSLLLGEDVVDQIPDRRGGRLDDGERAAPVDAREIVGLLEEPVQRIDGVRVGRRRAGLEQALDRVAREPRAARAVAMIA